MDARPFIKSAGGKSKLVPELLKHVPETFGTYYEPFLGGGALFWALQDRITSAVLSDLSLPLVHAYSAVRNNVSELIYKLQKMPNECAFFLRQRARDVTNESVVTQAAWFIYLNKTCFNGLWRVNKQGKFNVPFGRYEKPAICNKELLHACAQVLGRYRVAVKWQPFDRVLKDAKKGDLVYFDPPYLPLSATSDFTAYTKEGFGIDDHVKLRDVALALKARKVNVILSNSAHPAIKKLYTSTGHFKVRSIQAARSINSDTTKRGKIAEFIIT